MTAAVGTEVLADRISRCLRTLDLDGLAALYRADALFDASVPEWRYQLQGREAIAQQLREELHPALGTARVTSERVTPMADGVAVELEVHFTGDDGGERLWREVHLVHTDGEHIVEHVNYCTGIWDPPTIARHAVEAPMVRR